MCRSLLQPHQNLLRSLPPGADKTTMQLSSHFELNELIVSELAARRGIANDPTPEVIDNLRRLCQSVLEPLRVKLGRPVVITSGYRCAALNSAVGGSPTSHHVLGRAADVVVPGLAPLLVCQTAQQMKLPCVQIIHEFGRWAHLSVGQPGTVPELLTASLAAGKTVYTRGLCHV